MLLPFNVFAGDDDKIKLAVMEFEDLSGRIPEDVLAGATEYIRVVFASTNRYIIISKDRQKETIRDMRKNFNTDPRYKSCTDKNCQIQLGQALSADMIVKTTVSYFGGSYTISSELIDLEKEATFLAAKEDCDGTEEELKLAIDRIVEKIVKVEGLTDDEIPFQEKKPQKIIKTEKERKPEPREKVSPVPQYYSDSAADERINSTFTGRYNFGILANFDYYDKFGLSTGFDFDFNVLRKPYGVGAGNLFIGFGFDLRFYPPIKSEGDLTVMEIPILANFGYDFKIDTYILRYVGFWFSPGFNLIAVFYDDDGDIEKAFAWELGFEMIFRSRFSINLGFGGNSGNHWDSSHFFLNIGTIF
ncbi:hypothetical protein IKR20_06720 [bacterium]|nr:hypothetical protein [bacterium]